MGILVPTDPKSRNQIMNACKEISNSHARKEAENGFVKDVCDRMKEELGVPTALLKKLANAYHKRNIDELQASMDDFAETYDIIFQEQILAESAETQTEEGA